ncbi:MAG: OmcA/MtrC family decaheme c-type cytochrome [Gammaproteobacteria bacterium]|jgi:OmcA/MtrC family decaheme c-type cytochrome
MDALRHGNFRLATLLSVIFLGLAIAGCDGDDGDDGAPGAAGPPGEDGAAGLACWDLNENGVGDLVLPDPPFTEDLNQDGVVNVFDCNATAGDGGTGIAIGDGSELTEEDVETLGRLVATIDSVEIASPPVVEFTVTDSNGNPAIGIAQGVVWFTAAKLVPGDPSFNGGLSYWQSYVNTYETPLEGNPAGSPNVLESALQATTDNAGTLEVLGPGKYRYTFATDIADPEQTLGVEYEPGLTTRVGLEIRLSDNVDENGNLVAEVEVPLAPLNPVFDFVPDGGAGSGVTKEVSATESCASCHYQFELHGGPRKTVEYCVTCHNPWTFDQDTGEALDMAYMAHSIHPGHDRNVNGDDTQLIPYIIYGYAERFGSPPDDYSEVTHPQSLTYCENCHEESEATPDGNAWNESATAKTCGGCHADGLQVGTPDPVTGQPDGYAFNHQYADVELGVAVDGTCGSCHLGAIVTAGDALSIHSRIAGDQRFREETGEQFVLSIESATYAPGETPVITFRVDKPDGTAWDIFNDPEFQSYDPPNQDGSLNLYVAWTTDDIYNGDELGATWGLRDRGNGPEVVEEPGYPYRMYLAALQRDAVQNADGSYTVTYFTALPENISGAPMIALGGHPVGFVTDADGNQYYERGAATSAVFYPGTPRDYTADNDGCNGCHQQVQAHGSNRNGNTEICLVCHTADTAVTDDAEIGPVGWGWGYMIHNIHIASETYSGGGFAEVTYPQSVGNCFTCHKDGKYNTARVTARAVSVGEGGDDNTWLNDTATTPSAALCGTCHNDNAAVGHFTSNGGQVLVAKDTILGAEPGVGGVPIGQEACAVCHGPGSTFDTTLYHGMEE